MKNKHYRNWMIKAPLGLILIGFGLCLVCESAFMKFNGATTFDWVLWGTLSLIVFNSGICFFGDAVIDRIRFLQAKPDF